MPKKKVLLVLNTINDYRVETYNLINEEFDFTVAYDTKDQTQGECKFKKLKFDSKRIGPFHVFGKSFWKECKKYDAVITSFDIHNFEFAFVPFIRRKYKLLTWSIGLRCNYTRPYDVARRHELLDKFSYRIMKAADANIFYMEKAKEFWQPTKLDMSKVFVAPNTTSVMPVVPADDKKSILFVGSLYAAKGVDKLIDAFAQAVGSSSLTLDIVGKGDMLEQLQRQVEQLQLQDKVKFHGPIYDESKLAELFANALVCVSPTQAGLTVPKSMGYGVPVVTRRDAITGGEIYHIEDKVTGVLYDSDSELASILSDAVSNPDDYTKMGLLAKQYYQDHARPYHQAKGVIDALNSVFNNG